MRRIILTCCLVAAMVSTAHATGELNETVAKVAHDAIAQFEKQQLKEDDLAITLIDLRDPSNLRSGSFRGDKPIFPASVVKLFYLVATHQWLEDGKLQDGEELRRGLRDMIVDSTNEATNFVLETLTDAPGGGGLPDDQMKQWAEKRNSVNRYFAARGFANINVCQKTYCDGPYGREKIFIGEKYENGNKLTTTATARLLSEIVLGKAVSADRCKQMMELLHRDITSKSAGPDDQAHGFSAT